nr:ribosomal protein S3 [Phymatolithon calcareum]
MSQKINPISIRVGVFQLWNTNLPKYGKTFKCYTKFLRKQSKIITYLKHFLENYNLLIENISLCFNSCTVFINVFVTKPNTSKIFPKTNLLIKTIYYWLKIPVILTFYKKLSLTNSAFLINNYVAYLVLQGILPKKLLQVIYKMLKDQSMKVKLVQTTQGINKVILKGFKLRLSGCFETSRSQMSKTIKCNFGLLPLTKLKGYVEYSNSIIYTKFGSCGLKIWLFYELQTL